ncbi:succinate dehydrogenase cytochrome b560 subunit, mitochondrial isoform X2 [Bombyx mori]|uniref:Succinate dehydrogenase cytochrome b560 subunit, mitochondrial n=1 Tax=Bombyx mori TaxID=7091 RepID=A0A8R2HQR6_BOMMO|nr:succinate dehydrogenase cytochrome b560 subunit, mitochondrial [Bombyx mori]
MYCSMVNFQFRKASALSSSITGLCRSRKTFGKVSKFSGLLSPVCQVADGHAQRLKHQITYKAYVPPCYQDHDHKNMTLKRPMSPHLTVYAPTLVAMTSIGQRITGTLLAAYALLLSGATLFLPNGIETYVSIIQSLDLSKTTIFILKLLVGLPFGFHYFNGIRYCMFNLGKWLSLKDVYATAYLTFVLTGVIVIFFAFL